MLTLSKEDAAKLSSDPFSEESFRNLGMGDMVYLKPVKGSKDEPDYIGLFGPDGVIVSGAPSIDHAELMARQNDVISARVH